MATAVLKVAGCIETSNNKLLDIRKRHQYFSEVLNQPRKERTDDDWTVIKRNSKLVAKEILRCTDIVFSTCANVTSKWLREFRHECNVVFLHEGGCITETDALIAWKDPKTLIIAAGRRGKSDCSPLHFSECEVENRPIQLIGRPGQILSFGASARQQLLSLNHPRTTENRAGTF